MEVQQKESTMIHEILEAINVQLELKLTHRQISCLETGIYGTFKGMGINMKPLINELEKIKK
jgi:hypothetical protein